MSILWLILKWRLYLLVIVIILIEYVKEMWYWLHGRWFGKRKSNIENYSILNLVNFAFFLCRSLVNNFFGVWKKIGLEICSSFNPKFIMMDFERSAINAFKEAFTSTTNSFTMSWPFFHLQNSIHRKLRVNN